ncbi:hypothetical protein ACFX1X_026887 [Malus domestica]
MAAAKLSTRGLVYHLHGRRLSEVVNQRLSNIRRPHRHRCPRWATQHRSKPLFPIAPNPPKLLVLHRRRLPIRQRAFQLPTVPMGIIAPPPPLYRARHLTQSAIFVHLYILWLKKKTKLNERI